MFILLIYCHIALNQLCIQDKPTEGVVKQLIEQLQSKEDTTRLKAAKELGKLGAKAKEAIPALIVASEKDEDEDVRQLAKKALSSIEDATGLASKKDVNEVYQQIARDLAHTNLEVRIKSFKKIEEMGEKGKQFNALVVKYMMDKNPTVQRVASDVLEKIDHSIYKPVVALIHDRQSRSTALRDLQTLGTAGRGALPVLLTLYNTNDGRSYTGTGEVLKTAVAVAPDNQEVVSLVVNVISTDPRKVSSARRSDDRRLAISMIHEVKVDKKRAVQALINALSDSRDDVQVAAAQALAKFGPDAKPALSLLQKMKLDKSKEVRDAVNAAINAIN